MEERSPRLPVTEKIAGSNPVRRASTARYANWKSGEAQTFVTLRVRLPPLPLETCVGWALACPSGCNPPASDSAGSGTDPAEEAGLVAARRNEDIGPFVYRFRTPASHAGRAGSIPARVTRKF